MFGGAILLLVFPSPPLLRFAAARFAAVTLQGMRWMIHAAASLADTDAVAPGGTAYGNVLDFFGILYDVQKGPWEEQAPKSSASGGTPILLGAVFYIN
jgi:hypothetical protein